MVPKYFFSLFYFIFSIIVIVISYCYFLLLLFPIVEGGFIPYLMFIQVTYLNCSWALSVIVRCMRVATNDQYTTWTAAVLLARSSLPWGRSISVCTQKCFWRGAWNVITTSIKTILILSLSIFQFDPGRDRGGDPLFVIIICLMESTWDYDMDIVFLQCVLAIWEHGTFLPVWSKTAGSYNPRTSQAVTSK